MIKINGCEYKVMPYMVSCRKDDDLILFHMVSREMMVAEADRYEALKDGMSGDKASDETLLSELVDKRFLVPVDTNLDQWLEDEKARSRGVWERVSKYTIMTTTDCNAACPYCYERGRSRLYMSDQTAEDAADYILRTSGNREVFITWFGGEPLCNKRAADIISKKLRAAGKRFSSEIVTNGYLFDEKTVCIARNHWKLKKAQITLDGTEEIYNRTKSYRNVKTSGDTTACGNTTTYGNATAYDNTTAYDNATAYGNTTYGNTKDCNNTKRSPFRQVMNNIELLARNGICVSVRLNVTKHNKEDLIRLAGELGEKFKGIINIHVYASPVMEYTGGSGGGFLQEERFLALDLIAEMEEALELYGLSKPKLPEGTLRPFGCMADDPDAVVITPSGTLGKCDHHTEEEQFGSIYTKKKDEAILDSWKEQYPEMEECRECFYRPECIRLKKCPLSFWECNAKDREYLYRACGKEVLAGYEKMRSAGKYKVDKIKLAGHVFQVEYRYDYFRSHCEEFFTGEEPQTMIRITDEDIEAEERISEVDMSRGYYESLAVYRKICEYLADHNTALFHGSALMVDGKAYIFTGPSGVGKSTHAGLWGEYLGDRVTMINDDKPLLKFTDSDIIVYGTPYSGKSRRHTNMSAPLRTIVVLRKSEHNRIRKLSGRELFMQLYPQIYRPKSPEKAEKVLDLLNQLLQQVPVYLLEGTATEESFLLAKEWLLGE